MRRSRGNAFGKNSALGIKLSLNGTQTFIQSLHLLKPLFSRNNTGYSKDEGYPGGSVVKNHLPIQESWRATFSPWVGKIPWRRKWQPTPVFLPGKFHGQRSLAGYSPWGHKESDTTGTNKAAAEHPKDD